MTPCYLPNQSLLNPKVSIEPSAWRHEYFDYWGTAVVAFNVTEPHHQLSVTAVTELDFSAPPLLTGKDLDWQVLTDTGLAERYADYLQLPDELPVPESWRQLRAATTKIAEFVPQIVPHGLAAGGGDELVHDVLVVCRWAGIPARYVAGYLLPAQTQRGKKLPGRVYGWLQYWDGCWVGWDPLLGCVPDERHLVVGFGRGRLDVPVLFGMHDSAGVVTATTEVTVERLT